MADHVYVLDTSALVEVTDIVGKQQVVGVLKKLDPEIAAGRLFFPKEVADELEAYGDDEDPQSLWAHRHQKAVAPDPDLFTEVSDILKHPLLSRVVDDKKAGGTEEADPYVLAYGVRLKGLGHEVTVVTEDRRDRPAANRRDLPTKLSVATGCGILKLYVMPIHAYLHHLGALGAPTKKKSTKKQ